MLAEGPQTLNISKDNAEQLICDTQCACVTQGVSRQRAQQGSDSGMFCMQPVRIWKELPETPHQTSASHRYYETTSSGPGGKTQQQIIVRSHPEFSTARTLQLRMRVCNQAAKHTMPLRV